MLTFRAYFLQNNSFSIFSLDCISNSSISIVRRIETWWSFDIFSGWNPWTSSADAQRLLLVILIPVRKTVHPCVLRILTDSWRNWYWQHKQRCCHPQPHSSTDTALHWWHDEFLGSRAIKFSFYLKVWKEEIVSSLVIYVCSKHIYSYQSEPVHFKIST